jgi:hypothetical protein
VEFQKLDLNLIAYEIIKGVFFFPFPKVLVLYLLQPKNIRAYKCLCEKLDFYLDFIWNYLCGLKFELNRK